MRPLYATALYMTSVLQLSDQPQPLTAGIWLMGMTLCLPVNLPPCVPCITTRPSHVEKLSAVQHRRDGS